MSIRASLLTDECWTVSYSLQYISWSISVISSENMGISICKR